MYGGQKSEDGARAGREQGLTEWPAGTPVHMGQCYCGCHSQISLQLGARGCFCYFIFGVGEALGMEESQSKMSV